MKIKQTLELLPWIHKSKARASGLAPLYIRITVTGTPSKEVSVGAVFPDNWDTATKTVLKAEPGYREVNNQITETSAELIRLYRKLCLEKGDGKVSALAVKQAYEALHSDKPVADPAGSATGIPTLTVIPVSEAPPAATPATDPLEQLKLSIAAMQSAINQLLQQIAGPQGSVLPAGPLNPLSGLQQFYDNLLLQFNQLAGTQNPVALTPKEAPPRREFLLEDGFSQFITHYEILVQKGKRSLGTLKQWRYTKRKLFKFLQDKFNVTDIRYTEVMPDFGEVLYDYFTLELEKPLDDATAKKHIKKTKQILKIAVKNRVLPVNPIADFICGGDQKEVMPLELDEVYAIYKKDFGIDRLNQVADAYIFQCFTGFAYQDLYNLSPENIILVGQDRERWLVKDRTKTGVFEMVPILPVVDELIEKYSEHACRSVKGQLIPVDSNTNYNGYLKEIAVICKINRDLKTHLARHTFADIMLNMGVPLEDVSKMLGHKNIRTTQRYCRVNKQRISKNIEQFVRHALFDNGKLKMVG